MRKRRKSREPENADRWVVSYADFVTLLFAFFTTMYAISHVDVGKLERFTGSMRSAFKSQAPEVNWSVIEGIAPIDPDVVGLEQEFRKIVDTLDAKDEIGIRSEERGVVVSLGERLLFDSGRAEIRKDAYSALEAVASVLERHSNDVVVEGHTDNVPIRTPLYASNWELSTARATSVLRFLLEHFSLSAERFGAAGYAEFRPLAPNETPGGRETNRRVDIVIIAGNG